MCTSCEKNPKFKLIMFGSFNNTLFIWYIVTIIRYLISDRLPDITVYVQVAE